MPLDPTMLQMLCIVIAPYPRMPISEQWQILRISHLQARQCHTGSLKERVLPGVLLCVADENGGGVEMHQELFS